MLWFLSEPKEDFGAPAPWSFEGSPARDGLGMERRRQLCAGMWRPPSFVEKLLSGNRDHGDGGDSVSPGET